MLGLNGPHDTHLAVSLQLPGVRDAPLVSGLRDSVVDEVKFVIGAQDGSEAVESIPLGNVVSQSRWLGVSVVWINFDIEVVGEDFFSVAGEDEGKEEEEGELTHILVTCHGGGEAGR